MPRSRSPTTACSWTLIELRRLRRGGLPALLRGQDGGAFGATRALLPSLLRPTLSVGGAARIPCRYGGCWSGNDHSWLSRTRARLPHVHTAVFDWVLLIAEAGPRASASGWMPRPWRPTRRCATSCGGTRARVTGGCWRLAQESGIETPTAEDLARLDRKRKGKKLSNQDWVSRSDPEAKIAKMKRRHHAPGLQAPAVDLDTGAVVAAELHPADRYDNASQDPGGGRGKPCGGCGADGRRSGRMCDR